MFVFFHRLLQRNVQIAEFSGLLVITVIVGQNLAVVAIDYDPSATQVNQENRIKLMLSIARENMKKAETDTASMPVPQAE